MLGKVLVIAPYNGLARLTGRIGRDYPDLEIAVRTADLEEAVPLLDWARRKGFDLVVSRGGTALRLEQEIALPVVEIPVSGYDLFRLTSFIKDYSGHVSLIGFANVCAGVAVFADYLNVDISYTVVDEAGDVDQAIAAARQEGRVVIGDTVTTRKAEEAGVQSLLITSGPESVRQALDAALNLLRAMRRVRDRQDAVERSLKLLAGDPVLCDPKGNQIALPQSPSLSPDQGGWRDRLLAFFATNPGMPEGPYRLHSGVLSAMGNDLAVLALCLADRRFLLFHDSDVIGRRPVSYCLIRVGPSSLVQLITARHHLSAAAKRATELLKTPGPIALVGESGTGRTTMLRALQTASFGETPDLLAEISIAGPLRDAHRRTLDFLAAADGRLAIVVGAENLKQVDQEDLARHLTTAGHGTVLLFSDAPERLEKHGSMAPGLAKLCASRLISLPSIADDPASFEATILYDLMVANAAHGKAVHGFGPAMIAELRRRRWSRNYEELAEFLDRVVEEAPDGDHIITALPAAELADANETDAGFRLDLNQPLEAMEQRIIAAVLAEEGGNKARAAQRLGIGRSTLWRKLNGDGQ